MRTRGPGCRGSRSSPASAVAVLAVALLGGPGLFGCALIVGSVEGERTFDGGDSGDDAPSGDAVEGGRGDTGSHQRSDTGARDAAEHA